MESSISLALLYLWWYPRGAEDSTGHWDMMKGDLPYFLNGMDLAVRAGEVETATGRQG